MKTSPARRIAAAMALIAGLAACPAARAEDAMAQFEKLLQAAQQDKKGLTLHIHGQTVGGAVLRVEPGQWVELRGPVGTRVVVRLDRIDAITLQ